MKALALGVAAAAAMTAACGEARSENGPRTQRSFAVGAFDHIEVAGPYDVNVRTGPAPSVSADGSERDVERMVVKVDGRTLKIYPKKNKGMSFGWSNRGPVRVAVTVPGLAKAGIAGSGSITVDKVGGDAFEGEVAGSGGLKLAAVAVKQLKVGIAGSGEFAAAGRAAEADYEIAGSGDIEAGDLVAERARVSIAGSGNVAAHATDTAAVDIAGSGNVRMTGGAKCTVSKAGSGNVDCS